MGTSDFPLPIPNPRVAFRQLDDGGVLLSTADEVYFGVSAVGARIWSLLPPVTRTFDELCAVLAGEYADVSVERIRRDARAFLDELVAAGLARYPSSADEVGVRDESSLER
jgi:hypothetical protein